MPVQVWATWFPRMENRKASFKDFRWKVWTSVPEGKIHSTSKSATTGSARTHAGERWRLTGTRSPGTCIIVPHFASRSATRAGSDSRERRIPTRSSLGRSHWMAGPLREILWDSEYKDITVDTGIATSGPGLTDIFPVLTDRRARWKRWCTKCHSGWSFARRCSGMTGSSTNFGICRIHRDPDKFAWNFRCSTKDGCQLEAAIDGTGPSLHRLPYVKTDCTGSFEVANNSLAGAVLRLERTASAAKTLETGIGAVLEMVGSRLIRRIAPSPDARRRSCRPKD